MFIKNRENPFVYSMFRVDTVLRNLLNKCNRWINVSNLNSMINIVHGKRSKRI